MLYQYFKEWFRIPTLIEFFREGNTSLLVFPVMWGGVFEDFLKQNGRLSEIEAIKVLSDVTTALLYLHSAGVTHRDVKPAYILCEVDGAASPVKQSSAKICDHAEMRSKCKEKRSGITEHFL